MTYEVGQRVEFTTKDGKRYEATVTEVGEPDDTGSYTVKLQQFPEFDSGYGYGWLPTGFALLPPEEITT